MLVLLLSALTAIATSWQQPPAEVLDVLHAEQMPSTWTSPDGRSALLTQRVTYPPLADRAAAMLPLAGIRIDARTNSYHGRNGYASPRLLSLEDGSESPIDIGDARILGVAWSADGERLALSLKQADHIGLWVGTTAGEGAVVEGLELNPLLGGSMSWLPEEGPTIQ